MSITLDAIVLPADLLWIGEFDWSPVAQNQEYTTEGALIIEPSTKLAGRAITLSGGGFAWVSRSTIKLLYAKLVAGIEMTLTLEDGRVFTVGWRYPNPIETTPVIEQTPPEDTDNHYITLNLQVV